jgi:hypothetical protein
LHNDGSPASLYFYTPVRNGGMVFTRNFPGPDAEGQRYSVKSFLLDDLGSMLNAHRMRVEDFRNKGLMPEIGATQQARLAATTAFYDSEYGRNNMPGLWSPAIRRFAAAVVLLIVVMIWVVIAAR